MTLIKGVQKITGNTFEDNRGIIHEVFKNYSIRSVTHTSSVKNSLRGVHIQDWNKIVYLAKGKIIAGFYNPMTKQKQQFPMQAGEAYLVEKGIGNSYYVLEDAEYFYFNTEDYDVSKTRTVSYKMFDWPDNPIVSKKDEEAK